VVEAVASIRQQAESNRDRTGELELIISHLEAQSQVLEQEVGAFRITAEEKPVSEPHRYHPTQTEQPGAQQLSRPAANAVRS
jgi:hypothetical protein